MSDHKSIAVENTPLPPVIVFLCLCLQGFQMSLTLVQQWECHYLMDKAAAAMQDDSSRSGALDVACNLLGAIACPETPFR